MFPQNMEARIETITNTVTFSICIISVQCLLHLSALCFCIGLMQEISSPTKHESYKENLLSDYCLPLGSPSVSARGPLCDMDCFQVTGSENGHLIIFNGCLRWGPIAVVCCHLDAWIDSGTERKNEFGSQGKRFIHCW